MRQPQPGCAQQQAALRHAHAPPCPPRLSSSDVKDKAPLTEARKNIEREMERFKLCEKEAKLKAFSKAALGQADKLDPREQAKVEAREWINSAVDTLNEQVGARGRCGLAGWRWGCGLRLVVARAAARQRGVVPTPDPP